MSVITGDSLGRAVAFASDQVAKAVCDKFTSDAKSGLIPGCTTGENCVVFKNDGSNRSWQIPYSIDLANTCTPISPPDANRQNPECMARTPLLPMCLPNPDDPKTYNCQYAPEFGKDVFSGTCLIGTKEFCTNLSVLPYTCDSNNCTFTPKSTDPKKPDKPYVEWRDDAGCSDNSGCYYPQSSCDTVQQKCRCVTSNDCNGTTTCQDGYCVGGGQCVLGNFMLRQYCEEPSSRCAPNSDGSFPDGCKSNGTEVGATDVPAFHYNETTGNCSLTADYCQRFDKYYSMDNACTTNQDCQNIDPANPTSYECHIPKGSSNGFCSGPSSECYEGSTGKKIAQFFIGSTLFNMFSNGTTCNILSMEKFSEQVTSRLNKMPERIQVSVDPDKVLAKKILKADAVAPGVGLYLIYHKAQHKPAIGVIYSEVRRVFPKNVAYVGNELTLIIKKSELKDNPALKRLYGFLGMADELRENLFKNSNK